MRWNNYFASVLVTALTVLALCTNIYAGSKPEITSHTVQTLDRALSINVQWQSENPVASIKIIAGQGEKETRIDEYDNRRNPSGYSGEFSTVIPIDPSLYPGTVPYQIQLVDDLRQKSDLFSGQAPRMPSVAVPGMMPQPGMMPPAPGMMPHPGMAFQPGMMPQQGMPAGQQDDGWGRSNIRAGKGQGTEPGSDKSTDMVDKMLKVAERFDTPPALEPIRVNVLGPENVSFTSRANDDKGIRDITFRVYDGVGNKVGEQVLTNLGKKWEGSTQPIKVASGGSYRVVAQAVDTSGNTSKEEVAFFTMKGVTPSATSLTVILTPPEAVAAGAQWQIDGGAWQATAANVTTTVGKHTILFKDAAGWVKPVAQEFEVKEGPNTATGIYTVPAQINGTLKVTITPAAAASAGAQWRIGSGAWQNSGVSLAVPAGALVVEFKDTAGWLKPANLTVTVLEARLSDNFASYARLFTYNKDFEEGQLVGLEDQTVRDQLQLSKKSTTLPFIWVPNSDEGTISKINSESGVELGRYRVGPANVTLDPSRTTVDLMGNCWVGNRQGGTAVKIGLSENGQCVDRNGNGKIDTSTGSTALAWGEDECALFEVSVSTGSTYLPGANKTDYSSGPYPRGVAIDAGNNVWVSTFNSQKMFKIDGATGKTLDKIDLPGHTSYGLVVDRQGKIWSSGSGGNHVLRYNPADRSTIRIPTRHLVYGIGIDKSNHLYAAGLNWNRVSRINTATEQMEIDAASVARNPRSIAVTGDGDVWVTNYQYGSVTRLSSDLKEKAVIQSSGELAGVAVDSNGKVWAVDYYNRLIRINPDTNKVEKDVAVKGFHYSYSDMTGFVSRTMTTQIGTWTAILDSQADGTKWQKLTWTSSVPQGTSLKVRARSGNDQKNWSAWEDAVKDADLKATGPGRYIQFEVTVQVVSGDASPVLNDLAVYPKP